MLLRVAPDRSGVHALLRAAVEPCHQVAVGGAGGGEFVVAVLEVLALVEELLFEFGNTLTESADFVGSGEASLVEDLFAEDFGQPLAELGVVVAESFVVCAQVGEVGQQRPWLVRVLAGLGSGSAARARIWERRSWWRYRNERSTPAVRATAETVISWPSVRSRSRASMTLRRRRSLSLRRATIRGGCVVTVGLPSSDRVLATVWWVGRGARSGG